jgi:N-methylhydantoinase A/oxoprolinase/acetone carboxylase beta subunit
LAKLLGIDTGGTYTDAVLYDETAGVTAAAKALTTKHDLVLGVAEAMEKVLAEKPPAESISLVSLSTTLATNAIVEGHGAPVCLLLIGYGRDALQRAGLGEAMGGDPVVFVGGGHTAMGEEQAPLDLSAVGAAVEAHAAKVSAFAVAGYFGVRNPRHEIAVRDLLRDLTGLPVTCAHELTSNLDAPRRALTAVLNARLIPQLQQLVLAVRGLLAEKGISAPLMVVKGDGSLISDEVALNCPVETILSGPAASVVGACHLTGEAEVVVSDMGGTTTDIAVLTGGRPLLDREGAKVGGWRTMVEAVAVHTVGLGGDSQVRLAETRWPAGPGLAVGPRRQVPLSLLAQQHPWVLETLAAQLDNDMPGDWDGRFALRLRRLYGTSLTSSEQRLWDHLETGPCPLAELLPSGALSRPLNRLVDRGLVIFAGFTPSDAAHILDLQSGWSREAAVAGARLLAREGLARGRLPDLDATGLAQLTFERVVIATGVALVEALRGQEGGYPLEPGMGPGRQIVEAALAAEAARDDSLLKASFTLSRPLAAIGAPVEAYYPTVAERLNTRLVLPRHAGVCNAVGAVAGGIAQRVKLLVTQPEEGRYRLHLPEGVKDFPALAQARSEAEGLARRLAAEHAERAGAAEVEIHLEAEETSADLDSGKTIFVELAVTATAFGRPRIAAA